MGWKYVKLNKTRKGQPGQWKETKKFEVATVFLATGSQLETARITGVPADTIKEWRKKDWWEDVIKSIQQDGDTKLDARLSKAVDKALTELMDRIENGDSIYDQKTGQIRRTPAKLRDLNTAFNHLLDKRQLLRSKPTKIIEQQTTATQLQNLAEEFKKFVNKKVEELPEMHIIDNDTVVETDDGTYEVIDNAVHSGN